MACAHLPSVILVEIKLRDMDGIEVLKHLRGADDTASIPVIALSTFALPGQIEAAMAAGFFCYLTKPFKISGLMQAIDDALQCAPPGRVTVCTV
jgi:CheY-like chemotaxis protein